MVPLQKMGNPQGSDSKKSPGVLCREPGNKRSEGQTRLTWCSLGTCFNHRETSSANFSARFLWTFILSLGWLAQDSEQAAYRIALAYSGPSLAFATNYGGDVFKGATQNYVVYNNYNAPVLLGNCLLRVYSLDGTEQATINSQATNAEGVTLVSPNVALVLSDTIGINAFTIQESLGAVSLVLSPSNSATNLNHYAYFASGISDKSTGFTYATYYNLLSTTTRFYKIDIQNVAAYSSNTLNSGYGMSRVNKLELSLANTFMAMGTSNLAFISRTDLQLVKIFANPDLGYMVLSEPSDQTITYACSNIGSSDYIAKIDVSATTWENILPSMLTSGYVVNLVRTEVYRVGFFSEAFTASFRLFDIDTMTILVSQTVSGSLSRVSLRFAQVVGKSFLLSIVNPTATSLQLYNLTVDYCAVAWQNPCLACQPGRYLSSALTDNVCLKPAEFPPSTGIAGAYVAACATGCVSCTADNTVCTLCDNSAGYYLLSTTAECVTVSQIPDHWGLDLTVSPAVVRQCQDTHCRVCQSDRTQCLDCDSGYYLLQISDGRCYANSTVGLGSIVVAGKGRLAPCSVAFCGDCQSDYQACAKCGTGYYRRVGAGVACYSNSEEGFGLDEDATPIVLRTCADSNCRTCFADYSECETCKSPYYRLNELCLLGSPGYGPDSSNILRPCTIANCIDCGNSYTSCLQCSSPYYVVQGPSSDKCSKNDQAGFGLDNSTSMALIEACQIANCGSCYRNSRSCDSCLSGYYPTYFNQSECVANNISGKGLGWQVNIQMIIPCLDANCKLCFADYSSCESCKNGYFLKPIPASASLACSLNNSPGWGIENGSGDRLAACAFSNCEDCSSNSSVCTNCVAHTFPADFASGCLFNNGKGYGPRWTLGQFILTACTVPNCEICRVDADSCMNCISPYILNVASRTCVQNNVPGMGNWTDNNNFSVLKNCSDNQCLDCSADSAVCRICKDSSWLVDPVTFACLPPSTKQQLYGLQAVQPTYYDARTQTFLIQFSEPLLSSTQDLTKELSFELVGASGKVHKPSDYIVTLAFTLQGEVRGRFKSEILIEDSVLTLTHSNQSKILFRSAGTAFYPKDKVQVQQVSFVPTEVYQTEITTISKQAIMGVSVLSLLTVSSAGSGGGRLAVLFSVIEYIEYVLYLDGVHVLRGDNFLYFFSFDPLQLIPNWLTQHENLGRCDPGPNFARGQLKCDFLSNCGVQVQWVALSTLGCLLFHWALPKAIDRLRSPRIKSLLQTANYVPSHLFGPSLILTFVEGPQIDIIRSAFLNLLIYPSYPSAANLVGMLASLVALGLYALYAFSLVRIALNLRSQQPGEQRLPHNQFFHETFERIRLPSKDHDSKLDQWRLMVPAVVIMKNALIQALIVFLAGHGLIQIWTVMLIQVANICLWAGIRPYKKLSDNLHMVVVAVAKLCISTCLIIANLDQDGIGFEDRENYMGSILMGLYSTCIGSVLFSIMIDCCFKMWRWVTTPKAKNNIARQISIIGKADRQTVKGIFAKVQPISINSGSQPKFPASLQNLAPITTMKRGSVGSQKMIRISKPGVFSESSAKAAPQLPNSSRKIDTRRVGSSKTIIINGPPNLNKKQRISPRREETEEGTTSARQLRDNNSSFISISKPSEKKVPSKQRGSFQDISESRLIGAQVQQVPSFKRLPPLSRTHLLKLGNAQATRGSVFSIK